MFLKLRKMKKLFTLSAILALTICSCGVAPKSGEAASDVAIVAHRGFWNCEQAGYAQNSVAALKAAQDAGFWGSEFDVKLSMDGVVVANHDKEYGPKKMIIAEHTYSELAQYPLPNGEKLPTLADYLQQGLKCPRTVLVLEFKEQKTDELTAQLVDSSMEIIREMGLYDPARICFISFSRFACDRIVEKYPEFDVQFLSMNPITKISAAKAKEAGFEGLDYWVSLFKMNRRLVADLHKEGLKANVWTVDNTKDMEAMFRLGVDMLTTNDPLQARALLGERELKNL